MAYQGESSCSLNSEIAEVVAAPVISRQWKEEKLKEIIEVALVEGKTGQGISYKYLNTALSAINEANKMSGDHAPEKSLVQNLNLSADGDIKELMDLRAKMLEEKRKEY